MAASSSTFRFFSIENIGEATIARPVDPYLQGTAVAELIKLELTQIFETTACKTAIVDLHNVKLVSSSVISSLLGVKRHLSANGVSFVIFGMSESLRYVFRTLNMDGNVFNIVEGIDEALSGTSKEMSYYYDVCDRLSPPDEENA